MQILGLFALCQFVVLVSSTTTPLGSVSQALSYFSDNELSRSLDSNKENALAAVHLTDLERTHYKYVPDHSCDAVVVVDHGTAKCPDKDGCSLLTVEKFETSFFGNDMYYCRGVRNSVDDEDLGPIDVYKLAIGPAVVARAQIDGRTVSLLLDAENKYFWDEFRVVVTQSRRSFLFPTACVENVLPSIQQLRDGRLVGSTYIYNSNTRSVNCTIENILSVNSFLLSNIPGALDSRPSQNAFYALMSMAVPVTAHGAAVTESTFGAVFCDGDYMRITQKFGVRKEPRVLSENVGYRLQVCLLSEPRDDDDVVEVKVVYAHNAWYTSMFEFGGEMLSKVVIDIIEPVIRTFLRIVWTVLCEISALLLDVVLSSTYLTLTVVTLSTIVFGYAYYRARNLTSPCISVTFTDDTYQKLLSALPT